MKSNMIQKKVPLTPSMIIEPSPGMNELSESRLSIIHMENMEKELEYYIEACRDAIRHGTLEGWLVKKITDFPMIGLVRFLEFAS